MSIQVLGNKVSGENFIKNLENKQFTFSLVISYTETCEIPGITIAGADKEFLKFTSPADSEYLNFGHCKSIDTIPMSPDGKPTPALLTRVALDAAKISHVVINAGSKVEPKMPCFETGLKPGKNIAKETAIDLQDVRNAVDYGKTIGRSLAALSDCLVIGESIPGGTTTALAVLNGFGLDSNVSSSMPENPLDLKKQPFEIAIKRISSNDPFEIISQVGDPMIATVAGMLVGASDISKVILAGGTQMTAVLLFAKQLGYKKENVSIGTTRYIVEDTDAGFLDTVKKIDDIPVLVSDPKLDKSSISGLRSYSEGFVKEGVGAGGSIVAAVLKTGINSEQFLKLVEEEYNRVLTLQ